MDHAAVTITVRRRRFVRGWKPTPGGYLLCHWGAVAQLGEHLLCKQGVTGSIPVRSIPWFVGEPRFT